jgi:putative transposase
MARQVQDDRHKLSDEEWSRIEPLLPGKKGDSGAKARDNRKFIEAVRWMARAGAPWRDMPTELGNWHTTYTRFNRWCRTGRWEAILQQLGSPRELSALMIDSTVVRAHQHAAGAKKKREIKHLADLAGV